MVLNISIMNTSDSSAEQLFVTQYTTPEGSSISGSDDLCMQSTCEIFLICNHKRNNTEGTYLQLAANTGPLQTIYERYLFILTLESFLQFSLFFLQLLNLLLQDIISIQLCQFLRKTVY